MKTFTATAPGERLDAALALEAGLSRAKAQQLIEAGLALVNGKPAKASYRLRVNDAVEYGELPQPSAGWLVPEAIPLDIVFEDASLIVLNKPPGLVVHPGAGNWRSTLVHALLYHAAQSLSGVGGPARPGIVHRLDKDTSGLMVVAKTDAAHEGLARQFKGGEVSKLYLALILGAPREESGRIEAPIGRHPVERQRMAVREGGRMAVTEWRLVERLGACCTLAQFRLRTGRTHQIRVHAAKLGHPVAGDATYGGRRYGSLRCTAAQRRSLEAVPRQLLHSWRLGFSHPVSGERLDFEAPLPEDFASALRALKEGA
jgi:23S rRNA pseudouridine1911/1915/1917 synthase